MELELTLSPPNHRRQTMKKSRDGSKTVKKCPMVSGSQEEDDEPNKTFFTSDYQQDLDGEGQLIGWPPLHSWRRRMIEGVWFNERVDEEEGDNMNVMNNNYNESESLFVKVKMDGVGIARKIDLNAFHSYQMLTTTLLHMFDKYVEIDEDGATYTLMYQHKDGHWLLAGDLPWQMFIGTVQRIRVAKN